jgi:hypothetical protein
MRYEIFWQVCSFAVVVFLLFETERPVSAAGHRFTVMVKRETVIEKYQKIGRVGQSGAFFCVRPAWA